MANTTNFSVRMDSDIKKQCEAVYGELGINLTTAINVFLRQSLRVGGFPFDVRLKQPNKETIEAMLEAKRIARDPSVKRYSDVEEALKALKEYIDEARPILIRNEKEKDWFSDISISVIVFYWWYLL